MRNVCPMMVLKVEGHYALIHLLFLGETFWYDMFTFAHDVIITMFLHVTMASNYL